MQNVTIPGIVWGNRQILPHKSGTVRAVLPCCCQSIDLALDRVRDDEPSRTFMVEFRAIGEPPFELKGVPCGCGSGRTYTVQLDVEPIPDR